MRVCVAVCVWELHPFADFTIIEHTISAFSNIYLSMCMDLVLSGIVSFVFNIIHRNIFKEKETTKMGITLQLTIILYIGTQ